MRAANVTWKGISLDDVKEMDFSPDEFEVFALRPGDVLVGEASGSRLEVGKSAIWRGEVPGACFQNTLIRVRVGEAVLPEYLQKHLAHDARRGALADISRGIGIHHIGAAGLAEWQISLAPLPEQKRIADKLDALLARVDACRERLDRIPGILRRFRQSVLAAATSGELTREWREERGRSTVDYQPRTLRELVREPLRNGKSVRDGDGPMVLRLSSLRNGSIDWREAKSGEWRDIDIERFLVEDGDFLVARGSGSRDLVGRGSLVLGAPPRVAFPDTMIRVRPDPSRVVPRFLKLVWDADSTRSHIELSARTTAGIWKVAQPDLEAIALPVPAMDEQEEIVRRAEELLNFAGGVEARCSAALSSVERLTPSTLAKAFRGQLVPQDPNDEPAYALLAKLKTAQANAAAEQPRRRPKTPGKRPTMRNADKDTIRAAILKLKTDRFSFDELRAHVSGDYESLKAALFELLEEPSPVVRQVFDKKAKAMQLVRVRL
jgi:type I restriction enzyme S subunit